MKDWGVGEIDVAWRAGTLLGEGPVWLENLARLAFVDIKGGRICLFDLVTREGRDIACVGQPSFIYPADRPGELIYGSNRTLRRIAGDGEDTLLCEIPAPHGTRTNDAAVDPAGRLFLGMSHDAETDPIGGLYMFDGGAIRQVLDGIVVPNGPAISADGSILYHVDSPGRTIRRYRLAADGTPIERAMHIRIAEEDGYPDGVVLDSEGCPWVGLWHGWALRRYDPQGAMMRHISLPCACATKLAFGGPDLRTAFITTARIGLSEADLAGQPEAGSLFAFDPGVTGLPTPSVRIG